VHLRLLGTPALIAPDGTTRLLDLAAAATLALAALEPGMSRARIGALAWPASADPRGALRQLLVRLRRQWGFDVLIGRSRLSLAPGVTVDVTDAAAAATLLSDLGVSALPGFAEWLEAQRQTRAGHARAQAELLLAQAQAAGDPQAARRLAEQLDSLQGLVGEVDAPVVSPVLVAARQGDGVPPVLETWQVAVVDPDGTERFLREGPVSDVTGELVEVPAANTGIRVRWTFR